MINNFDDSNRQVIPRWLDYSNSCALNLLTPINREIDSSIYVAQNPSLISEWRYNRNIAIAVDIVSESLIMKEFSKKVALEAANYILTHTSSTTISVVREIAEHFLEEVQFTTYNNYINNNNNNYICIANIRRAVRVCPYNPIAWSELALCYAMQGYIKKSQRAMITAISLGKNNRYILRSASRCFLHLGDTDRALFYLRESELCKYDPWIASAEIAISEGIDNKSSCIKKGRMLLNNDNLHPFDKCELAACLGTIEIKEGSVKKGKKLLKNAAQEPTENALAQIEWMSNHHNVIPHQTLIVPASYEAQARYFFREKEYEKSLPQAIKWSYFQPFSTRPIILATYIASVCLNDDLRAISIADRAMPAVQHTPIFLNNYAFSLARIGKVEEAKKIIDSILKDRLDQRETYIINATEGLINFRSEKFQEGRYLYKLAIDGFLKINDKYSAAIANFYLAYEEKRSKSIFAINTIIEALKKIRENNVLELEEQAKLLLL